MARSTPHKRQARIPSGHLLWEARPLLLSNLRKRQAGANSDYVKDRMLWIAWQAQRMHLFPHSDADARWIVRRPLLRQLETPLFRALARFAGRSFGVSRRKRIRKGGW